MELACENYTANEMRRKWTWEMFYRQTKTEKLEVCSWGDKVYRMKGVMKQSGRANKVTIRQAHALDIAAIRAALV